MSLFVEVEILENGAIYVNGNRITDRSTKWGLRRTVETFECQREEVAQCIAAYGYSVKKIDVEPYLSQSTTTSTNGEIQ